MARTSSLLKSGWETDYSTDNNIIRNIVAEILRECKHKKIDVTADFIKYYIGLYQLDPNSFILEKNVINREVVQKFIKYLMRKFENRHNPQIVTLKIQHAFQDSFAKLENVVNQFRKTTIQKIYPLLINIVDQQPNSTYISDFYHKLTIFVTLCSGLGNPKIKSVHKEIKQVIQSVLEPKEVKIFPSLPFHIKQEVVNIMVDLTTGMRLYNHECKKGGEGIPNLPQLLENSIATVKSQLNECIYRSVERAEGLTRFIKKYMNLRLQRGEYTIELNFKNQDEKLNWIYAKDLAVTYRQIVKISKFLLNYLNELSENKDVLVNEYKQIINHLNKIIKPKYYMDVTHVFSSFYDLSKIWKNHQDNAIRLQEIYNIFKTVSKQVFSMKYNFQIDKNDSEMTMFENNQMSATEISPHITVYSITNETMIRKLEFNGYCPWMILNAHGALVPGNIDLGIIKYKKKLYCFSSKVAVSSFIRNPEEHILKAYQLIRSHVYLIKYLDLQQALESMQHIKILIEKRKTDEISLNDTGTQTDIHAQDSFIDNNYSWNLWDYKRTALKQCDVLRRATKHTMTTRTYFRDIKKSQTYDNRETLAETLKDNYCNTTKLRRYMCGLRGNRKNESCIVNIIDPEFYCEKK